MSVFQVCLVGSRHYSAFGAHGADSYVSFAHFNTLDDCCRHLKDHEGKCSNIVLLAVSGHIMSSTVGYIV